MKKDYFSITKKFLLIFVIALFSNIQIGYSQCTNATPTGTSPQTFCKVDNSTVADLVASGGTIVWYDAPTGGTQYDPSTPLFDGVTYYADDISSNNCSVSRLAVLVSIVGDIPTNVDVYVGKCASQNPTIADLNATGTNIEWFDAQTGGNLLASTTPLTDGQTYWVQQTESGCTSVRLPTTVSLVDPTPPTVEPIQSYCYPPNPTVGDLQATGTNIVWYDTETSTTPLNISEPLVNGEDYWAVESSFPCESTTRVQTTVQLDAAPNAGTDGSLTVCEIDLTTTNLFTLLGGTPSNTGSWTGPSALSNGYLGTFEPGVNVAGTYTYTVSSTNGICPDDSANVTVVINTTPPPTTTESNQAFCEIDNATVADLAISGNNVQWYDTETSTTPLNSTDLLINGQDYWASQTDATTGCESATRTVVNVTINVTPPPTTTQTNQAFCEIDNATVADIAASGNAIQWYDTETSTTPLNSTDNLIDGEDYWATQTDATTGCESATRTVVNVTINVTPPPTTTQTNQAFCEIDNATVGDLAISGNAVQWYDTETSTTPLNSTDLLVDGEDYWATQTDATTGCESATRTVVNVTINVTPPPTTTETNQAFCLKDYDPNLPTVGDLSVSGNAVVWYDTETSTTPLNSTDNLIDGEVYWATQTDATSGCESATRLAVTVTFINPVTPTTSETNQTFCVVDNATVADLQANGTNIVWYDTETSTTPLNSTDSLIDGEDYWAAESDASSGCESINRLQVTVTITDNAPVTITETTQTFCASDEPTVENLNVTGSNINWYESETATTPLSINELLVDGEDYWATQTNASNCESSTRMVVNVVLTDPGTPIISTSGNEFCIIDNPTVSDLNNNVTSSNSNPITWYDSYPNGNMLNLSDPLIEGNTYYAVETDVDGCSSVNPLQVTVNLDACDQYDVEIFDGFSPDGDGINDTFEIGNLKALYPNFKLEFYNRWGKLIYTQDATKPNWNGRLNGSGNLVPTGVYYFVIHFNKNNRKPIQKRLYLNR
ncbi:MAG: gliding motility-associated C-terminal domain-containing protein [Lutibacter sp.]|uniref:gliding motility-associated C-terminal domain-containing protein n=1 Tax=Lutibacter sp. TaxID=1925666 RepID=UPI00299DF94B|nr:gliding motility-associated C-terminal domain-containing protein [Lutibacter sp.]MDX1830005.1 gliding motility-associated C-terminal domain-containing protein [Lutibacter sp.]